MTIAIPPIESFAEFEARALAMMVPEFKSRFGAVTLDQIDNKGAEHEHLIKGILTRGEVSMLVGPSGSGKSFLATDMAMCIARGRDFFPVKMGARIVRPRVRRGGVLYIAGEGARGLKKRLRAYLKHHGCDPADVPFVLLTLPVDLHSSDDHINALIAEAQHYGRRFADQHGIALELVVVDTLSASTPGANENASDDMSRVLGRMHRLAIEANCAVQLVHHMNASGLRERGHSSLRANVDSVIEVVKHMELKDIDGRAIRIAKITKQKDGEDGISWRFVLPSVELGFDADGDPITSCIVAPPNMGDEPDEPQGFKLTPTEEEAFRALVKAIDTKGTLNPMDVKRCPSGTRAVLYRDWRDQFAEMTVKEEDGEPEKRAQAIKKALERAGKAFIRFGLIDKEGTWLWRTSRRVRNLDREHGHAPQDHRGSHEPDPLAGNFQW